jgi:hypothetical protein
MRECTYALLPRRLSVGQEVLRCLGLVVLYTDGGIDMRLLVLGLPPLVTLSATGGVRRVF